MGRTLITGGAGFIGSNLADTLSAQGEEIIIYDSLVRPGTEKNLAWLKERHPWGLEFIRGDVRSPEDIRSAVRGVDAVFHLASQVAVTTSVMDPVTDFEINARGTLNVLEAARSSDSRPCLFFTSTNKVYGGIEDVLVVERKSRYEFADHPLGIPETRPLDFHSPYGCSKGAADQYVHDYARIYGLRTVVFRMSCIYGPRQFGNEDQGWVAHFLISALSGRPITIYGDGKQVRDILYVEDLVRAFQKARERISSTAGHIYNVGGGPKNTISVWAEFKDILGALMDRTVEASYAGWRPGDQRVYVSDISKAKRELNWEPAVGREEGIRRLYLWVKENRELFN